MPRLANGGILAGSLTGISKLVSQTIAPWKSGCFRWGVCALTSSVGRPADVWKLRLEPLQLLVSRLCQHDRWRAETLIEIAPPFIVVRAALRLFAREVGMLRQDHFPGHQHCPFEIVVRKMLVTQQPCQQPPAMRSPVDDVRPL